MDSTTGTEVSSSTTVKCNLCTGNYSKVDMMLRLYNEHEFRSRRNGMWISSLMNRMQCCHCADCNFLSHKHNLKYVTEYSETPHTSGMTTTPIVLPDLEMSEVTDTDAQSLCTREEIAAPTAAPALEISEVTDDKKSLCTSNLTTTPNVTPELKILEETEDGDKQSLCNENTESAVVTLKLKTSEETGGDRHTLWTRENMTTPTTEPAQKIWWLNDDEDGKPLWTPVDSSTPTFERNLKLLEETDDDRQNVWTSVDTSTPTVEPKPQLLEVTDDDSQKLGALVNTPTPTETPELKFFEEIDDKVSFRSTINHSFMLS